MGDGTFREFHPRRERFLEVDVFCLASQILVRISWWAFRELQGEHSIASTMQPPRRMRRATRKNHVALLDLDGTIFLTIDKSATSSSVKPRRFALVKRHLKRRDAFSQDIFFVDIFFVQLFINYRRLPQEDDQRRVINYLHQSSGCQYWNF